MVFVALALALFGRYNIDLSRFRAGVAKPDASRASLAVPFVLGALSAVLAGAQASEGEGIPGAVEATPATFAEAFAKASADGRPVFVDCWATWCKNCFAMDRTTLADVRVREALKGFAVIRLQADDIKALREFAPFADVKGLPAYAVFDPCCNQ